MNRLMNAQMELNESNLAVGIKYILDNGSANWVSLITDFLTALGDSNSTNLASRFSRVPDKYVEPVLMQIGSTLRCLDYTTNDTIRSIDVTEILPEYRKYCKEERPYNIVWETDHEAANYKLVQFANSVRERSSNAMDV